jgi:hypothetical protein
MLPPPQAAVREAARESTTKEKRARDLVMEVSFGEVYLVILNHRNPGSTKRLTAYVLTPTREKERRGLVSPAPNLTFGESLT